MATKSWEQQFEEEAAEARDPNTPPHRLLELMGGTHLKARHALEVLQNPAFQLMLVAQPDLWEHLPQSEWGGLVESPHCPLSFVSWVFRTCSPSHWLLMSLAENRSLPKQLRRSAFFMEPETDDYFIEDDVLGLQCVLPLEDFLPPVELALLRRGGLNELRDPFMFDSEVNQLSTLGYPGRRLAEGHLAGSALVLEKLRSASDEDFMERALRSPWLPPELLARYLSSPNPSERQKAARNPSMTEMQFRMAVEDPEMRADVAQNPALPAVFHLELSKAVRWARIHLAKNPHLSPDAQLELAADPDRDVRRMLLVNPNLTAEARRIVEVEVQVATVDIDKSNDDIPF